MNKVFLKGNLGGDPEQKTFDNGGSVVEFSLATNRTYKNRDGEKVEEVEWHRCKAFGGRGEVIAQYSKKGDSLIVFGRITYRSYEKDGETKYITEIVVEDFEFNGQSGAGTGQESNSKPAASKGKGKAKGKKPAPDISPEEEDDLPF